VKKKKLRNYDVSFAVRIWSSMEITAENYDAALAKARKVKFEDLVEVVVGHNGSSVELIGVTNMTAIDLVVA